VSGLDGAAQQGVEADEAGQTMELRSLTPVLDRHDFDPGMTVQPPLRVVVLLTAFNAVSSVLYSSLLFFGGGYERWASELRLFVGPPGSWGEVQIVMLGAFFAGALLTPDLTLRMARWVSDGTTHRRRLAILQGILRGYGVVLLSRALGFLVLSLPTGGAGPAAGPSGAGAPVLLGLLAGIVVAVPVTPVVLLGGALNGLVCLAAVARTAVPTARMGGAVQRCVGADEAR
jgi:hypothetical protein